jgi:hypothetical protein
VAGLIAHGLTSENVQPVHLVGGWCLRKVPLVLGGKYCWLVADKPDERHDDIYTNDMTTFTIFVHWCMLKVWQCGSCSFSSTTNLWCIHKRKHCKVQSRWITDIWVRVHLVSDPNLLLVTADRSSRCCTPIQIPSLFSQHAPILILPQNIFTHYNPELL